MTKSKEVLKGEIVDLRDRLKVAIESRDEAISDSYNASLRVGAIRNEYLNQIEQIKAGHQDSKNSIISSYEQTIAGLKRELSIIQENFEITVEDAVIDKERAIAKKSDLQDKEHDARMNKLEKEYATLVKNLEKEHAAKIAKCDKDLESDKISYRKYLRTEYNTRVDSLEKANKEFVQKVAGLEGENSGLHTTVGILEGQLDSMTNCVGNVISALPTVSAQITTPDISVSLPGAQQVKTGGEQKKPQ